MFPLGLRCAFCLASLLSDQGIIYLGVLWVFAKILIYGFAVISNLWCLTYIGCCIYVKDS